MTLTSRSALLSAAIGTASGLRSSVGISAGLLTWFRGSKHERLSVGASALITAGELTMDKLPTTPSRLDPAPLGGRILAGVGAAYAIARRTGENPVLSAVIGGVTSVAGSYAGASYRGWASKKVPPVAAAVVEDAAALAIGAAVLDRVRA
ncbi:hypothetical protein [Rhodococcoides kyotonense]|uniref:DUF4126 domain-containing protein n=1 Tax=Rhodococcoides kyotonense TaxID=398843 RepID=A0A239L6Z4_9NOCA|nr:hypothetical protein [Rhodococcus kyotonensis]SNT26377.1 hypothetical protein SAMN05421642_11295 [Rhodococcus kyotonensis]